MEEAIALLALTAMEIVLGIDNIIFVALLTARLPRALQPNARRIGLGLALIMRILMLLTLKWILGLTAPLLELSQFGLFTEWLGKNIEVNDISVRDLILMLGGLFLIGKSVHEIHEKFAEHHEAGQPARHASFSSILVQIALMDIIFSLDSVITAIGMAENITTMVAAVVLAMVVMLIFAETVSRFVERNPTLKMLALSFLILIGVMLLAEGAGTHVNKGYIYFAMTFALVVEFLNLRLRRHGLDRPPASADSGSWAAKQ